MDDLKLCEKSKDGLEALINTVRISTDDTRTKFGINKCVTLAMNKEKKVKSNGILMPSGRVMGHLTDGIYAYLVVTNTKWRK